jgi:uncharacterized protein
LIFVDTSALYALADRADNRHREALALFEAVLASGEPLLTHNYVLVEAIALLQHRLGAASAVKLANSADEFEVAWVEPALHRQAVRQLERSSLRRVSLVDHVSFLVIKERRVEKAFAFDPDFARAGFQLLE